MKLAAYYFPNWHVDPRNEQWHGTGWTEWQVVKYATPRFPGHKQPKVPLWGYDDEADPRMMEKKITTAVSYGIESFIFDWYWMDDGLYRERCLEEGFLKAANTNDMEFGIMWANHNAILAHPATRMCNSAVLARCCTTPEIFKQATDYCIKNYFCRRNYMRIGGKVFFSVFSVDKFIKELGGIERTRELMLDFRKRVRDAGLGELYFNAIDASAGLLGNANGNEDDFEEINRIAKLLTLDSWGTHMYGISGHFPDVDYSEWVKDLPEIYRKRSQGYDIAYNPCISVGWDTSPRTVQSEVYELGPYPYTQIVHDNTPQKFKKALQNLKKFAHSADMTGDLVTINSWNEWTEGAYLEPDQDYGFGYLEAVRDVFKKVTAIICP